MSGGVSSGPIIVSAPAPAQSVSVSGVFGGDDDENNGGFSITTSSAGTGVGAYPIYIGGGNNNNNFNNFNNNNRGFRIIREGGRQFGQAGSSHRGSHFGQMGGSHFGHMGGSHFGHMGGSQFGHMGGSRHVGGPYGIMRHCKLSILYHN